ncbi:hypothetical protein [Aquibacillus saliphilus]|uniref:hypothetical protein n=1 Tax=Aquibacillus saliphilus TaxID=1909422 RepID=UPI001CF05D22|nr:hypothetical protein [Aquibacillus saliphilus]
MTLFDIAIEVKPLRIDNYIQTIDEFTLESILTESDRGILTKTIYHIVKNELQAAIDIMDNEGDTFTREMLYKIVKLVNNSD